MFRILSQLTVVGMLVALVVSLYLTLIEAKSVWDVADNIGLIIIGLLVLIILNEFSLKRK